MLQMWIALSLPFSPSQPEKHFWSLEAKKHHFYTYREYHTSGNTDRKKKKVLERAYEVHKALVL